MFSIRPGKEKKDKKKKRQTRYKRIKQKHNQMCLNLFASTEVSLALSLKQQNILLHFKSHMFILSHYIYLYKVRFKFIFVVSLDHMSMSNILNGNISSCHRLISDFGQTLHVNQRAAHIKKTQNYKDHEYNVIIPKLIKYTSKKNPMSTPYGLI